MRDFQRAATRVARSAAGFDLVVTGLLAAPGLEQRLVDALMRIDAALGFATPAVALPALALFFANLAGALGVLWAVVRLAWPWRELVGADVLGRCAVAALIGAAIARGGVTPVLWAFVATELAGAAAQAWALGHLPRRPGPLRRWEIVRSIRRRAADRARRCRDADRRRATTGSADAHTTISASRSPTPSRPAPDAFPKGHPLEATGPEGAVTTPPTRP